VKLLREQAELNNSSAVVGISTESNGGQTMLKTIVLAAGAVLLLSASGAMAQMRPAAQAVLRACKPDIARFCSQVPPGQGRIKACMKEHLPELSEPCKEGLFQAWLRQ
jgi:Cysteine rich repeat